MQASTHCYQRKGSQGSKECRALILPTTRKGDRARSRPLSSIWVNQVQTKKSVPGLANGAPTQRWYYCLWVHTGIPHGVFNGNKV